ncbi:Holo-ACP synthase (4\'-phosphopantetheinyl transferase AcpS) [Paracholeplasma brassicae]|uniref:Holo-[acyl-carrier-protein] synthase n=1 Tax=Acholeplasma brassicae TaxID=61635 RepID=U4KQ94_9MOLU|nr:holo-ACP synthase [Paracholeplasma brassicae]CCV66610.1 Holo-ACP synthase (4\'-phosphopantetheinyl transferase AcpS) [Paracholeplasma brassicae]
MFEVGIDLVDLKTLESKISEALIHRLLSVDEFNIYEGITDKVRKLTFLGGRFAAKEALFKAFKQGDKTANYRDFTVLNDLAGAPYFVQNAFLENVTIKLSITHTTTYASAVVLLIKNK